MDKMFGQGIITGVGGIFIYLFGAWDIAFQVLVSLIFIDYATGVMVAYLNKKLSSQLGIKGIFKKIAIVTTVAVAVLIDRVIGTDVLRLATIFCLCGNEGISLLENLTNLGAPIPQKLVDALMQLKGKGDEPDESIH
ncbi:MAG: phage holin family protein [Candidatus Niameybacter stercoravium]|nr:phage holin family protein [Candidatus Niameybacter stercoravium]